MRGDATRGIAIGVYRRLAVVDDWGAPLGLGNSVNALLFGRDEGFYYRAMGVELSGVNGPVEWRLFGEQQRTADVETQFSVPHLINGFEFRENVVADARGPGGSERSHSVLARASIHRRSGCRARCASRARSGDLEYGRGALDITMTRSLPWRLAGALTMSGGTTAGDVPPQRLWYLGGTHTMRGHGDRHERGRCLLVRTRRALDRSTRLSSRASSSTPGGPARATTGRIPDSPCSAPGSACRFSRASSGSTSRRGSVRMEA